MILQIIITIVTFTLLDAIWLGIIAKPLYIEGFGKLMTIVDGTIQPYWPAGIIVYIALILGILCFVLPKANGSIGLAFAWGALYGFVTYATYDFTNLAVLTNWTWKISIIDTCWGMFLCGITSMMAVLIPYLISGSK